MRSFVGHLTFTFKLVWGIATALMLLVSALSLAVIGTVVAMFPLPIAVVFGAEHQETLGYLVILATPGLLITLFRTLEQKGILSNS